ncbi:MAG TPA: acyclic terpene utilization AtuA family protein [Nocardioidaceae bacterium]|nr:acyclic terpene utilization AtuA family protein [Nocardioidaceae bacterium]
MSATTLLRIGNCSGFYGDRLSAMREMLEGGELDVLTGDYLAELTMLILGRDRMRDASLGYARTFLTQAEDCLGLALERGVRLVANAGGLNPAGLAERLGEVASGLGLAPAISYVDGDDLLDRVDELGLGGPGGKPLTANAYLGGFGIAAALSAGADVVVTGRVTDASLVVGPAAAHFGWPRTAYDEIAGAMVAGHVIECGAQACGGNFSGFTSLPHDATPLGFPIAEIAADGSSVITKHPGTGGAVGVDTVTAQLVYEVQDQTYVGPDAAARLDTIRLAAEGADRVRISGVRGGPPPDTLKVCLNELGGYRNDAELVLTGLDIDEKAAWVRAQAEAAWPGHRPASVQWTLARTDHEDADSEEAASARLRVTVRDPSPDPVGRAFTAPLVELALASYPGFTLTSPPGKARPYGVYRAAYVDRSAVAEVVTRVEGAPAGLSPDRGAAEQARSFLARPPDPATTAARPGRPSGASAPGSATTAQTPGTPGPSRRVPLGAVAHARSGDKGGDANVGVWARDQRDDRAGWLTSFLTAERVRALMPEADGLDVEVHALPNLRGLNVVIHGLLGEGVAASTRFDPQAKGLGEWLRSRHVDVPEALL